MNSKKGVEPSEMCIWMVLRMSAFGCDACVVGERGLGIVERNENRHGTEMPLTSFTRLSFPYSLIKHEFTEGESVLHPPLPFVKQQSFLPHTKTPKEELCARFPRVSPFRKVFSRWQIRRRRAERPECFRKWPCAPSPLPRLWIPSACRLSSPISPSL